MFFSAKKEDKTPEQNQQAKDNQQKARLTGIDEFFSDQIKRILICASQEAKKAKAEDIDTEYLLLGLILKKDAVVSRIFEKLKIKAEDMEAEIRKELKASKNPPEKVRFSPRAKTVLELADRARRELRHHATSSEHLLIALVREGEGVASRILKRYGANPENISGSVISVVGKGQEKDSLTGTKTPMLDKYGIDLVAKAREGKIDPVIGRTEEIERASHILARRRKNNPVLVGEAGVGKTAIVEGLALRISVGDVPDSLKGKRIIEISMSSLMAGASRRGEFETRVQGIIKEATNSAGEIIMFIDELHTIISSNDTADVANIFKPALARGELHMVGATTNAEYHQYIESDRALERRFQPVRVGEPTVDECMEILKGIRDKYEAFHKVKISDEILQEAIKLTDRYINDRFLPDKAVDLIDEAAAVAKMPSISTPAKIQQIEKELEHLIGEREQAKKNINIEEITRIEKMIKDKEKKLKEEKDSFEEDKARSHDTIEDSHLQEVMSKWTGVPLSHMKASETEKLLNLEEAIHEEVIGQDEAVKAVCQAVRRGRAGLKKLNLPIGSFLFMGPTGVGKTQIAKTLATNLLGMESAMIRFDMSEFMERHAVARLLGPPPGYVGYEAGGELTEAVRKMPFSIILFDEVEKAHPDTFRIFLQLLDDGRLTDNHGRTISFKNTIIICTSNLAAMKIAESLQGGFPKEEAARKSFTKELKNKIMPDIMKFFKPEMVNRFDELVFFEPLSKEHIVKIVDIFMGETRRALKEKKMTISLTDAAKAYIAEAGFDPQFGARPLKRALRMLVDDPLSDLLIRGEFNENDHIIADLQSEGEKKKLSFHKGLRGEMEKQQEQKAPITLDGSLEDRLLRDEKFLMESADNKTNNPEDKMENNIFKNLSNKQNSNINIIGENKENDNNDKSQIDNAQNLAKSPENANTIATINNSQTAENNPDIIKNSDQIKTETPISPPVNAIEGNGNNQNTNANNEDDDFENKIFGNIDDV